jgi:hypothetical protein
MVTRVSFFRFMSLRPDCSTPFALPSSASPGSGCQRFMIFKKLGLY